MKQVIMLVGPKGAGKSTIGDILEKELGIRFVRVEPVFLAVREELGQSHPDYERRGFEAVLARLKGELGALDTICFESTGASSHVPWLLAELERLATVLPVQILADAPQCKDRIRQRDASIHIPVSDDQVARINALAFQVELPWAACIDNRGPFDRDRVVRQIRWLLQSGGFCLEEAVAVLERTPASLGALLAGLPERWVTATEGEGTWSPYDVIGHLIHGERADWIPRARHILAGEQRPFDPFDRTAQFTESQGKSLGELLATFAALRQASLAELRAMNLTPADLARTGRHPALGDVTLGQLLATWVVHDLDHVGQIARTMAKAYKGAVGPWSAYLSILHDRT